jgi:hypothetical protein
VSLPSPIGPSATARSGHAQASRPCYIAVILRGYEPELPPLDNAHDLRRTQRRERLLPTGVVDDPYRPGPVPAVSDVLIAVRTGRPGLLSGGEVPISGPGVRDRPGLVAVFDEHDGG